MVKPSRRTKSTKKIKKKSPGGRTVTHYKRKDSGAAKCGRCGRILAGVKAGTSAKVRNTSKSGKAPGKPYSGELCNKCLDDMAKYVTRTGVKYSGKDYSDIEVGRDLTLEKFLPRGWFNSVASGKKTSRKHKDKSYRKPKAASKKKEDAPKAVKKKAVKKSSRKKKE
ncbi:MAG: hypothetical protein ABIH11_02245 [Candidatus Altiarchaeota archaeon]